MVGFSDFLKSAALTLHIAQSAENIGKHRIELCGGYTGYITILYPRLICHIARSVNCHAAIADVNMDFAAKHQIITMDKGVEKSFKNASFAILRHMIYGQDMSALMLCELLEGETASNALKRVENA